LRQRACAGDEKKHADGGDDVLDPEWSYESPLHCAIDFCCAMKIEDALDEDGGHSFLRICRG
jgi:hypothetical protein